MSDTPIMTRPVNAAEKMLRQKFAESVAGQSEQMDKLAQQLITLELAVPGLYAAVLQLVHGKEATVTVDRWLYLTFGCWFLALALTLFSLIPRRWQVDPTLLKGDIAGDDGPVDALSLEEFFYKAAQWKRRLLIAATLLFWLGVLGATLFVF